jgi:hypothetical protein
MNFCLISQIALDDLSRIRDRSVLAFDLHIDLVIQFSNGKDLNYIHICTIYIYVCVCVCIYTCYFRSCCW